MESRGNGASYSAGGINKFASTLHWGTDWTQNKYAKTHSEYTSGVDLDLDYHTYGLYWTKDRLFTYIDNENTKVLDVDFTS